METNVADRKVETEAQKNWDSLQLDMTVSEFEAYIHKIEEGDFMLASESKTRFVQWLKERKQ